MWGSVEEETSVFFFFEQKYFKILRLKAPFNHCQATCFFLFSLLKSTTINKQVKKYGGVQVGDFIQMEGNRRGVVRFIGTVHFGKTKQEIW
jgi:hypothetical protein